MARTLEQIQKQIDKLNEQAEKLKAREAAGVIERIKTAIAHYGLSASDLFGSVNAAGKGRAAKGKQARKKKSPSPIKYRDDKGNSWTGHGKRPRWFIEAIDSGKTREDLAAKP